MLSRFHLIPGRDGRTDRRTDRIAISVSRVSMLTRDKMVVFSDSLTRSVQMLLRDHQITTGSPRLFGFHLQFCLAVVVIEYHHYSVI